jgi:nucleoside-diphosphate-sugar epimerase
MGLVEGNPGPGEHVADLLDLRAVTEVVTRCQPDLILHLAAIANVAHGNALDFYRVNVMGSMNLLEAVQQAGLKPRKIIMASSANIYGNNPNSPVRETEAPAPLNHYAMSKLAMEHMARTWLDRFPIAFTRPFNYTGPGQTEHFLIPKIVGHFLRGEAAINLGNLDVTREFNDVRMVARAYVGLLADAESGDAVNICSGRGYALGEVLDLARNISGRDIEVKVDPRLVRPNELKHLVGSPDRLLATVPDLPEYRLEDTLRWMLGKA